MRAARRGGAFVNINSAVGTFESIGAEARAVVDAVRAGCAVEARRQDAIVHVRGALRTAETGRADAVEPVDQVSAGGVILARRRSAVINVDAVGWQTGETGKTHARLCRLVAE